MINADRDATQDLRKKCSSLLSREPMFEKLAQEETKSAQILLKFT
jgi:hypothetical protein